MAEAAHFDQLETRDPGQRELAQFNLLPDLVRQAIAAGPGGRGGGSVSSFEPPASRCK